MNYFKTFVATLAHPVNRGRLGATLGKIIFWKLNQLTFKLPALINLDNGYKCLCYPDSSYGGLVVYTTYPDYEVVRGIKKNLRPGGVFVDVGANIGLMSLVAAGVPQTKIHAFEPSPVAFPRLCENIYLNNLSTRTTLNQLAVSDKGGRVSFFDATHSELSHIAKSGERGTITAAKTLDAYAKAQNISAIDVLKIDVEGAELRVLKGARELLSAGAIKHLYCELNSASLGFGASNSLTLRYLKSFGYRHSPIPANIDNLVVNIHAWKNN